MTGSKNFSLPSSINLGVIWMLASLGIIAEFFGDLITAFVVSEWISMAINFFIRDL
jgi:hypothetical protein